MYIYIDTCDIYIIHTCCFMVVYVMANQEKIRKNRGTKEATDS